MSAFPSFLLLFYRSGLYKVGSAVSLPLVPTVTHTPGRPMAGRGLGDQMGLWQLDQQKVRPWWWGTGPMPCSTKTTCSLGKGPPWGHSAQCLGGKTSIWTHRKDILQPRHKEGKATERVN